MDVHLSPEQATLQEAARDFLSRECPGEWVREQMEDGRDLGGPLWTKMADLGWLGLIVPERFGGADLDLLSLAVLCEEMGRALLPEPYLSTVAIGSLALVLAGSEEQQQHHLPAIVEGRARVALAQIDDPLDWSAEGITTRAESAGGAWRLSGCKRFVNDAQWADWLIVPARTSASGASGISLFLLDVRSEGVTITPIDYTDQTRRVCNVELARVRVDGSCLLGPIDEGWPLLERILDRAKVALAAEMLGGAAQVLDSSVTYAKQREQFGKPIGSFQAIQHKCADQFIQVEGMRSAVYYAAWAVGNEEPDAHLSACLAKSYCADAYVDVAAEGIQIHGGLGFTWEQDLHLYYKRAKASQLWLGDGRFQREAAAGLLLDAST